MGAADSQQGDDLLGIQHQRPPEPFWAASQAMGHDGYYRIEFAGRHRWEAIASWGRDGWDLGKWPLIVIFHREYRGTFDLAYNVEGDVTAYRYRTRELRDAATDALAFFHWQHDAEPCVAGVATVADAPAHLRGPFSCERLARERRPDRALD